MSRNPDLDLWRDAIYPILEKLVDELPRDTHESILVHSVERIIAGDEALSRMASGRAALSTVRDYTKAASRSVFRLTQLEMWAKGCDGDTNLFGSTVRERCKGKLVMDGEGHIIPIRQVEPRDLHMIQVRRLEAIEKAQLAHLEEMAIEDALVPYLQAGQNAVEALVSVGLDLMALHVPNRLSEQPQQEPTP